MNAINTLKANLKLISPRNKFLGLVTAACAAGMLAVTAPKNEEKIPVMTNEDFYENCIKNSERISRELEAMSNYNQMLLDGQNELIEKIQKNCEIVLKEIGYLKHDD